MRLEHLEISGFKSFPERAGLAFDEGVTAIVGPNGCGKSNVVDAITWVLGEQSAKSLRGERMEDVIFNGSDARRPTAAAEVRLRLSGVATLAIRRAADRRAEARVEPATPEDVRLGQIELPTTEAREVELARRLYRSGESEYLIDGEVVRLRDIQDLLMDAGLGVKGYAVIEQGKIGQILSAKPTERRQLIEEAAGVTKYKSRRRAAELKLEAAQQNLTRVEDIIFELERQRNALRRQAAKARRYRRLREELRRWEKVLFARRHRVLGQAIEAARARLTEARLCEATAAGRVGDRQRAFDDVRERLARAEALATSAREASHARQLEVERRLQQLEFDRQQVESLSRAEADLASEIAALESRREPARAALDERREASVRAEQDRREADGAHAQVEVEYARALDDIVGREGHLEAARGRVTAGLTAAAALRNVMERAKEGRERIAVEIARLDAEAADLNIEIAQAHSEHDHGTGALHAARQAMERTGAARAAREAEVTVNRAERDERVRELREQERELAAAAARLRSLEELDAGHDGYGEAARAILNDGAAGLAHFGPVADFVEADRHHERAVEACLGDLLQSILVQGTEDAARGLNALRERNLGRCGFLIVDGEAGPRAAGPPPPDAVSLSAVVRVTGPYASQIHAAIGEAWICERFDVAAALAAATTAPVATVAGEVFRGGRLVFGGGRAEARGILATKREIKERRERLAGEHERVERLEREVEALESRIVLDEQTLATLVAELHQHEKTALEHELRAARATEAVERLRRKLELVESERRRAEEELRALEARQDEAARSVVKLELEQRGLDEAFAVAQTLLTGARDSTAALGHRVAEAKAAHAALGERATALAHEVRRLEEAGAELEERLTGRIEERQRTERRRGELARAILDAERQLDLDQQDYTALQERVRAAENEVADLQAGVAAGDAGLREARTALDEARAVVGQLDVVRVTAESDLAHLGASCLEALHLSIEQVTAEVEALEAAGEVAPDVSAIYGEDEAEEEDGRPLGDVDVPVAGDDVGGATPTGRAAPALTAEEAIAELRAKIDRLGPVNMMAIEQFDELEGRYTFLSAQRQDLVDSIAATGEAIKRIDRTTRERFREAYAAINRYFEETFTTLFGGGRSGLVLLDEDDLLESGIDIIAQPPGKRLQNVQLLSGGEKALTAMALLFAMFRYRPSPFCLLDEIDAPLDDANIGRFLEMLRAMLDRTQFIVITHSRKTMEMADRLYGITMEEPGVSKLISLKLN